MQMILYCIYKIALMTVADMTTPLISVYRVTRLLVGPTFLNFPRRTLSMLPCASTILPYWRILQHLALALVAYRMDKYIDEWLIHNMKPRHGCQEDFDSG